MEDDELHLGDLYNEDDEEDEDEWDEGKGVLERDAWAPLPSKAPGDLPPPGRGLFGRRAPHPADVLAHDGAGTDAGDATGTAEPVYALLRCESVVVVGQPFPLEIGLAPEPVPDVFGEPMYPPASYRLAIDVVAEGFELGRDEDDVLVFDVTPSDPYPTATVHLTPQPQVAGRQADIRAIFSADGQPMGVAFRPVRVVTTVDEAVAEPEPVRAPGISVTQQRPDDAVDLTILVFHSNVGGDGDVVMRFRTRHVDAALPQLNLKLGDDLDVYVRSLVSGMGLAETSPAAFRRALGIGRTIARTLPPAFSMTLREVAERVPDRPMRILLVTEEPYVPWELVVVPRLDGRDGEGFLGAEAVIGRWVVPNDLPEPHEHRVEQVVVVSGHYPDGTLAAAEEEAFELGRTTGAVAVDARLEPVLA
ncbi:MAG: hypothetical protein M3O70_04550, partial [Actinomycetota bacterium]|nr:hypothetical protein [Actinomycetota bacterium]